MYRVKVNICTVYKWTYVQCTSELLYSVRFNIYKVYNSPVTCTVQSLISSQAPQPFPTTAPHTWQEAGGRRQEAGGAVSRFMNRKIKVSQTITEQKICYHLAPPNGRFAVLYNPFNPENIIFTSLVNMYSFLCTLLQFSFGEQFSFDYFVSVDFRFQETFSLLFSA